jgi:hypothetical protein
VTGGLLSYEVLPGATEPVPAIERKLWNWLRAEAPDTSPPVSARSGA